MTHVIKLFLIWEQEDIMWKRKSGQWLIESLFAFFIYVTLLSSFCFAYVLMKSTSHKVDMKVIHQLQEKEEEFQTWIVPITSVEQVLP